MKIKSLLIAAAFIIYSLPSIAADIGKDEILSIMEFPKPDISIGNIINNPFFAINIMMDVIDVSGTEKKIKNIENVLTAETDPEIYYKLGSYYKDLNNSELAVKHYKTYLKTTPSSNTFDAEQYKSILIKGDIYYSLSEIDVKSKKVEYLENALLYLTRSIELNPENVKQWVKLGDCYLSLDKTTEALYCYNKALDNKKNIFQIYPRLQAAEFQRDFVKLSETLSAGRIKNQQIIEGFNFDYIETAINNSPSEIKDSLKLQHYIYLLRLLILKNEFYTLNSESVKFDQTGMFTNDEKKILSDADIFLKTLSTKKIKAGNIRYLSGIISYLNSDYKKAIHNLKELKPEIEHSEFIQEDIIFISIHFLKDEKEIINNISEIIKVNPQPEFYLAMAEIEFKNKNYNKSEMICTQSLKINKNYAEAYSGIAFISALNGNYITADEMIKKGNFLVQKDYVKKNYLFNQMKLNEAAISLLKNEKERGYVLLRSILSVDNNEKASRLYNRYFNKK